MYGDASTNAACDGTVSGSPRTHRNIASDGPAPPRRPGSVPAVSSTTRTPSDCNSTSSRRSSRLRRGSGTGAEGLFVVAPEDPVLEFLRDVPDAVELPVLTVEVRPRLVGAEEHAIAADALLLDLGQQPARAEADRPRRVSVHLVPLTHPLQELRHQLDVT